MESTSPLAIADLTPQRAEALARILDGWGAGDASELEPRLARALTAAKPDQLKVFQQRLASTGSSWSYQPPDPVARLISRVVMDVCVSPESTLEGTEFLEFARSHPVFLVSNHLSYADSNALDYLLDRNDFSDIGDRITAIAGPKVYAVPFRRLASLCFGTIKTAQSSSRASGKAKMARREVARRAADSLRIARERNAMGDHIAIFVEGTRSRAASMQPALAAVSRYIQDERAWVLPWGFIGGERLMPIKENRLIPTRVTIRFGKPLEAKRIWEHCDGNRSLLMHTIGFRIADLLPESYRGVYRGGDGEFVRAREIANRIGR